MLEGMSGERISLSMEQNGHLLCLGKSGSGKSFYLYRRLEELWQNGTGGRRYAVLDYSGSFTLEEMKKAGFRMDENVYCKNLQKNKVTVCVGSSKDESAGKVLGDILVSVFKIKSYIKKALLMGYCKEFFDIDKNADYKPLSDLFVKMTKDLTDNIVKEREKRSSLIKLVEQMVSLEHCNIAVSARNLHPWKEGIHVMQLSGLAQYERCIYANLLLRLFWYQAQNFKSGYFSAYVVDEFQHLDLSVAAEDILREGRKYGVSFILASQFIGEYQKKFVPALKQAGNQIFFRPADSDIKILAEQYNSDRQDNDADNF